MHNSNSEKDKESLEETKVLPLECNNFIGLGNKRELPKRERRIPKRYVENCELGLLPQKNSKTVDTIIEEESTDVDEIVQEPFAELRTLDGISLAGIFDIATQSNLLSKLSANKPKTSFSCDFCKFLTLSQNDLFKHVEKHKNCILQCKECETIFKRKKSLELHHETTKHVGISIVKNYKEEKKPSTVNTNGLPVCLASAATTSINIIVGTNGQIQSIDATNIQPIKCVNNTMMEGSMEATLCLSDVNLEKETTTTGNDLHTNDQAALSKESEVDVVKEQGAVSLPIPNPAEELKELLRFDKSGRYKSYINSHKSKTLGKYKFVCLKCLKEFDCCSAVRRHQKQTHNDERNYKCQECSAAFKNKTNFEYHMAKHNNIRNFKCSECSKAFTANYDLVTHMRIHTGEQPYTCDICGKNFRHRSNLIVHQRLHSGTKPYKCDICEATFNSTSHLKKHKEYHISEAQKEADMKYKQEHTIKPKLVGVEEFFRTHYESLKTAENEEESDQTNVGETTPLIAVNSENEANNEDALKPDGASGGQAASGEGDETEGTIFSAQKPPVPVLKVHFLMPFQDKEHQGDDGNASAILESEQDSESDRKIYKKAKVAAIEMKGSRSDANKNIELKAKANNKGNENKNDNDNEKEKDENDDDGRNNIANGTAKNDSNAKNGDDNETNILDFSSLPEDFCQIFKFQCHVCYKYFKQKCALTKHIRTHTGEKPYTCPWCPRAFSDPSNFKKHKMLHINEHTQRNSQMSTVGAAVAAALRSAKKVEKQMAKAALAAAAAAASIPSSSSSSLSDPDPDGAELIKRHIIELKKNEEKTPDSDDTDNDFDNDILDDLTTAKGPLIIWPDFKSNKLKPSLLEDIETNDQSILKVNQTKDSGEISQNKNVPYEVESKTEELD